MSKSRGNVVNPDDLTSRYGTDTVRLFLMFIGPWDQGGPWNPSGIDGVHRFLAGSGLAQGVGDPGRQPAMSPAYPPPAWPGDAGSAARRPPR